MLDSIVGAALHARLPDARGPPFPMPPRGSIGPNHRKTSKSGHGGPRANSGGLRSPAGGRPPKPPVLVVTHADEPRWYCVRAKFNQEKIADEAVRLDGFTVFNPSIFKKATPARRDASGALRPGKPDRVAPLLGRYFFVELNLSDPYWYQIKRLPGVECVMSGADLDAGGSPAPIAIPARALAYIRGLLDVNECYYPERPRARLIEKGARLRLTDGPLAGHVGICDGSDGLEVRLSLMIMGHLARVAAPQSAVEAVKE